MSSFFLNTDTYINQFIKRHNIVISKEFTHCADIQLASMFEKKSGLKINKLVSIGWAWEPLFFYHKNQISKLASEIWINNQNTSITIAWKSKSGKIYDIADTEIDCADIEFWFEDFDALLYQKQMYPNFKLPFKLKDLSYELVVTRLNMECVIEMKLRESELANAGSITDTIDQFIDDYNTTSEKKDREYGILHNWKSKLEDKKLIYEIDTGFTGAYFLKKMLLFLSELNALEKVEVM